MDIASDVYSHSRKDNYMEIRVLRYFLEIAREGNMTRAADYLHVSQPTLSKQMKELETELGKKLFRRGSSSVSLTSEGMLFRKRAEDILDMVDKTTDEFHALDEISGGEIRVGCAETHQIKYLARIIKKFKEDYPLFRYHLTSGNTEQVTERLDKGLFDFAIIVEPPDLSKYNYIEIPEANTWGVIMKKDSPLAPKERIYIEDLVGLPLICSEQSMKEDIPRWCGEKVDNLILSGSTNLFYNGSVFVKEGLGYMLTFDQLVNIDTDSDFCFRPLEPVLETKTYVIWKKYQMFTPIAERLLELMKTDLPKGRS